MSITDTTVTETTRIGTSTADDAIPDLLALDSADAVITNARRLLPVVAEEADEMERIARLSPRLTTAFRRAGVFQMAFPAFRGGLEMGLRQQLDVVAEVATVDASAAWNIGVLNATGYYAARLGDEAYAELYPTRDMPTSGSFHPRGRAQVVPGGYLVSGHWDWGSGSYVAEHVIGSANVFDGDQPVIGPTGKQLHLGIWLPREAITVCDNWQVLGVSGSGSTSYEIIEPAFVPASHSFDRDADYDQNKDPLNRSVHVSHFALTGVALGVARHLVDITADIISARGVSHLDAATLQRFGEAIAEVDFAYAGSRHVADITDDTIFSDRVLTPTAQARMTGVNAVAGLALRRVVDLTTDLARAGFIRDVDPMQRVLRDAYGALAHAGTRRDHLGALARAGLSSGGVDTSGMMPAERARELFAERG
ncbi:acyl-CoA dehydrogenase family protein [Gordonia desulfuricans]|uniref:acyl-CoA dehydrogenase family protein n=1 Tax=Gordonia desulfuricans TaxID=89051 RepID=UPI000A85AFDA|nr:acyl-CoA dehydrogenase family protein [Gordonia desulfuricans]